MTRFASYFKDIWKQKKLFLFFLGSYIPFILILLVFSIFSYSVSVRQISDNVNKYNLGLMEHISAVIDQRLVEIERTSHRLSSLNSTAKLAYMDENNEDFYYEMTRYVQNLWPLWLENDELAPRFYVYFKRSGILAAPDTFYQADEFYGEFLSYDDLNMEDFFEMLLRPENNFRYFAASSVELKDQPGMQGNYDMVLYNYQLKRTGGPESPGTIFFLIDIREVREMLEVLEIGEGGIAAILRSDGKPLVSLDNDSGISDDQLKLVADGKDTETKDKMAITVLSDKKGWKYLALGSRDVLLRPVLVLRQIMLALIAASLAFALAFSLWMARRRSMPLFEMVCRLNDSPENPVSAGTGTVKSELWGTGYKSLEYGINAMLEKNVDMKQKLESAHPMLLSAFLYQLFRGMYADDKETEEAAGRLDLSIPAGPYRLVLFSQTGSDISRLDLREDALHLINAYDALLECLGKYAGTELLIYQISMDRVIWIQNSRNTSADENEVFELLDNIARCMSEKNFKVSIRFSRVFRELSGCWWEYEQLKHSLTVSDKSFESRSDVELVWHDPDPDKYQYMLLVGPILSSLYRAGDERMLGRLFDIVKKEIFDASDLDPGSLRVLITQFEETLGNLTGGRIVLPGSTKNSDEDNFIALRDLTLEMCRESVRERSESGSYLLRKICEYTDSQLFNPLLSMTMIADKMNISENYLSRIFKEQYGETLSNYIEKNRITAAQDLLKDTMMSISDIAVKAGYNSDHVFRRAFRRVTGLSPVEFRQGVEDNPGSDHI